MASWDKSKFSLSQNFAFEACGLIYRRWSEEFELLKAVKAEKPDKRDPDWHVMHAIRLKNHTQTEAKWSQLKNEAGKLMHRMMNGLDVENIED